MLVPIEALPQIRCSACNKYLSYFPIHISPDSKQTICGRCFEHLDQEDYIRAVPYESLAQYINFPCVYDSEGCVEHLVPADIPNHEKYCAYRIVSCALDCVWQGTVGEIVDHVEEHHPNMLLRDGEFEVDILNSYEVSNFLVHNDEFFSFKRKFDKASHTLQCSVSCYKSLDSITKYFYEITVYNGSRSLSKKFPLKSADNFLEENITEINIETIKKMLADPSIIIGAVKIYAPEERESSKPEKKQNPDVQLNLLAELECPVCFHYIIPPIYQCITGHSICGDCKSQVSECPTCKGDIKNTQNFTLEKMAYLLTFPCKFVEYGCDFASKPGGIKQHQKFCLYGPQDCPLKEYEKCGWQHTAKEVYNHVVSTHSDSLLELDTMYVFFDNGYFEKEDYQCYIKKVADSLFKFHFRYWQNCFYWAMQLIGPPEQAKNFKFEIDIIDNSNNNQKLFLRSFCAPVNEKEASFTTEGDYVFLKVEQIRSFITDQLNYTIRITK